MKAACCSFPPSFCCIHQLASSAICSNPLNAKQNSNIWPIPTHISTTSSPLWPDHTHLFSTLLLEPRQPFISSMSLLPHPCSLVHVTPPWYRFLTANNWFVYSPRINAYSVRRPGEPVTNRKAGPALCLLKAAKDSEDQHRQRERERLLPVNHPFNAGASEGLEAGKPGEPGKLKTKKRVLATRAFRGQRK